MAIHESAENYLETILMLSKERPVVRAVDIANELDFKKSSVSIAMKNLRGKGYITVSSEGYIVLTEEGKKLASDTYERHTLISQWLVELGGSPETASADACRIEHDLSQESFDALKRHIRG